MLDERYNEGGFIADYVVDVLSRNRFGAPSSATEAGTRSGGRHFRTEGDADQSELPARAGMPCPGISARRGSASWRGTRRGADWWGSAAIRSLLDGGQRDRAALRNLWSSTANGRWKITVSRPMWLVEDLPKDVAAGHDKQLETGVQMVLDELKAQSVPEIPIPPYPNYHKNDSLGGK